VIGGYFHPAEPDRQLARVDVRIAISGVPRGPDILVGEVPFVIDTGSETTCLHPADAVARMRIDPDTLRSSVGWRAQAERIGVGGTASYFLLPCLLTFTHTNGTTQTLEIVIEAAQLTSLNATLPSVLGWDVLQHFAMRLDWSQRLVEMA
jgi:hypothetical protein